MQSMVVFSYLRMCVPVLPDFTSQTESICCRVPTPQGNRRNQGKWQQRFPVRENTGNLKFCQNTEKTQGIWFAQVVHSLILKVMDISIFATKKLGGGGAGFCVCNSQKSCKLAQGKFVVGQGKHREFENAI